MGGGEVMSKLTPKKYSKRQIAISNRIEEMLNGWGFKHYVRHCSAPKYGEDSYIIEDWSNEDMADFIVTDLLKLANKSEDSVKE